MNALNFSDSQTYFEKIKKFQCKSVHDCYKLVWQWSKENSITLSVFENLIEYISENS